MKQPNLERAVGAINGAVGAGSARVLPYTRLLQLTSDTNPEVAVAAIRANLAVEELGADPVGLWHDGEHLVVGPTGVLRSTRLVSGNPSLEVRVTVAEGRAARVVLSWLDGPTLDEVSDRLAAEPDSGLKVELVAEGFEMLVDDVVEAALTTGGDPVELAAHPVLQRVDAIRDDRDIYFSLLDLTAALLPKLMRHRRRDRGRGHYQVLKDIGELSDQDAVDAVLDDLDARMAGSVFLPLRPIDDRATLTAVFVLLGLTGRALTPAVVRRTRSRLDVP